MSTPRIALISGSTRTGSMNRNLVRAMAGVFKGLGAKPVIIDLAKYEMPLYNGDFEAEHGVPQTTKNLVRRLKACDGVFIGVPEYNGGLPPLLKNTIDWSTRLGTEHFSGPVYGIGSATPGGMSGIMVLKQLHFILSRLGASVIPVQLGVGFATKTISAKGRVNDEKTQARAEMLAGKMLLEIKRRG